VAEHSQASAAEQAQADERHSAGEFREHGSSN
jgi:hypothetical protein